MYRKRIRMNGSLKKIMLIANVILWIIVNVGILVGIFLIARESLDAFINGEAVGFNDSVIVFGFTAVFDRMLIYFMCFWPLLILFGGNVIFAVVLTVCNWIAEMCR